ncbi:MAG TPA: serine/threonine-protein kinase [Kofleriaceae bacterium]|jgi:tetratricopeptide (TPR) repeat protein
MTERDEATEATRREGHARANLAPSGTKYFERGALVGRYVIIDKLGEGGMGVVYSAFDPELDRKVAIKLLTARSGEGSTSGGDQAWLLREAQALARLQHPNVVAVHDVGTLASDQVFVAMELVDGATLRGWLRAASRTWREVLPVMRAAGAGLAAAHAAGLVHRDFKPENVLVGKDGRVRVMDFGLARLANGPRASGLGPREDRSDAPEARSPMSDALTMAGQVVGTPAYMAPEIYDGVAADARTDQFAFAVTLAEALYHGRPFERKDLVPPRAAAPKPKLPAEARVPAALERVVVRALAIDPAQRFAAMEELLAALAIDPAATRRRAGVAGGAVMAIAAVAVVARLASRGSPPLCKGIDKRLAGVWDPTTSKKVHDAFVATKLPFAERSYGELAKALDGYAKDWVGTAVGSCEATRVRGEQTEKIQSLRQGCLDQRLEELAAVTRALSDPTKSVVEKSGKVIEELEPLGDCSNVLALAEPTAPPPELIPRLRELDAKLAEAKAQVIVGNYISAGGTAVAISKLARDIHYAPAEAVAEQIRGMTLMVALSYQDAEHAFVGAALSGLASKHDDIAAHAALSVAMVDVEGLGKPGEAKVWLEVAQAAAKRYGADPLTEMRIDELAGVVAAHNGDVSAAMASHEKALAEGTSYFGHDNPLLWEHEQIYATSLTNALEYAAAVPHFERARELRERVVGKEHLDIAVILSNLGICYMHLRDPRAKDTLERSLAMREKLFGKASPILVAPLDNLGSYQLQAGDLAGAIATLERALKLSAMMPGKDHPAYHQVATDYALALSGAGRFADARKLLDDALAIEDRTHSPIKPTTETARAELALAEAAWADAVAHGQAAIDGFEAAGGKDNPELWRPLSDVARADVELGQRAAAQPLYARALAIGEKLHLNAAELAATRDGLAALQRSTGP